MTEQEGILLQQYHEMAFRRRGLILNEIITLERMIDYYIATHFCKTEEMKQELMEQIISTERITLSSKIHIFLALITKYEKTFCKNNPTIGDKLNGIMKRRNIFAHYQLDTTLDAAKRWQQTTELTFIQYTGQVKTKKYTKGKAQAILDEVSDCMMVINQLNIDKA